MILYGATEVNQLSVCIGFNIFLFSSVLLAQVQMHPSRSPALEKFPLQARMRRKRNRREVCVFDARQSFKYQTSNNEFTNIMFWFLLPAFRGAVHYSFVSETECHDADRYF